MTTNRQEFEAFEGGTGTPTAAPRDAQLSECKAEKTASRRDAIEPLIKMYETPFRTRFPYVMADGASVKNWGEAIAWCARRSGRSVAGVRRLWTRYRRSGPEGIERRKRNDKGRSRFFSQYPSAALFALSLILRPGENASSVHRQIAQNAEALGIPPESVPSRETVRQWLKLKQTGTPKPFGESGAR